MFDLNTLPVFAAPLHELDCVTKACDFVLMNFVDADILPYINNNLQEILRLVGSANVSDSLCG